MSPANYEGYYGEPPVVSPSRDQGMEGFPRPCSHKMLPKHNMTFPAHMNYVLIIQHFIKNLFILVIGNIKIILKEKKNKKQKGSQDKVAQQSTKERKPTQATSNKLPETRKSNSH